MHLITLTLTRPATEETTPDPVAITDLLWSHARPENHVEHLRVRAGPDGIDLAVFVLAEDEGTALLTARDLCTRALRGTPGLADWHLVD